MKKFISKCVSADTANQSVALLFIRLFVGFMMLTHGWAKLMNFGTLAGVFPDPIGLGSTLSLALIIFAEVGCSLLLIFGLLTRLATLPLMFGMFVAIFFAHANDPFQVKELAVVYLGIYFMLFLAGPGRFSVDCLISKRLEDK